MSAMSQLREVSVDEFEDRKENIRILAAGRPATGLLRLRDPSVCDDRSLAQIEAARKVHENKVALADDTDDPLDEWLDYLRWADETYPTGGPGSQVDDLLSRITEKFANDERYLNNAKLLGVWLRRIDSAADPTDLFAFLRSRRNFKDQAAFYERYAEFLERSNQWREADAILLEGLEARAKPLARLQRTYRDFCVRLSAQPPQQASSQADSMRRTLADSSSASVASSGTLRRSQVAGSQQPAGNIMRAAVAVFEDSPASAAAVPRLPSWQSDALPRDVDAALRKENEAAPGPWNRGSAPLAATALPRMVASHQPFAVFEDNGSMSAALAAAEAGPRPPSVPVQQPADEEKGIRRGYNIAMVYTNGCEFSFEEMRAQRYLAAHPIAQPQQAPHAPVRASVTQLGLAAAAPPVMDDSVAAAAGRAHADLEATDRMLLRQASLPLPPSPGLTACATPSHRRATLGRAQPSPTINMRLALEDIDAMWKQPLPGEWDAYTDSGHAPLAAPASQFTICEDSPSMQGGEARGDRPGARRMLFGPSSLTEPSPARRALPPRPGPPPFAYGGGAGAME